MANADERDAGSPNIPSSAAGDRFQVKDALVLIPLFGGVLAMTWEVGQFYPTGGFLLFSLSEHLLAAIGSLPFALIAAVAVIVAIPFFPPSKGLVHLFFGSTPKAVARRDLLISAAITFLSGIVAIVTGVILRKAGFFGLGIFFVGFAAFFISRPSPIIVYAFFFVCSLIITMGLSIDQMRLYLNENPNLVSTIYAKTAVYRGKVIMSGEHGLFFFRPDQHDFVFQRQDEIQRIEWPRFKLMN
jgi:hypothetical protein